MIRRVLAVTALGLLLVIGPGCGLNLFEGNDVGVYVENHAADPVTVTIHHGSCSSGDTVAETTVPGASSVTSHGVEFHFDRTEPWSLCLNGALKFESSDYDPALAPYVNVRVTEDGILLVEQGSSL